MQGHATEHLDIKMSHAVDPLAGLAHYSKGFRQNLVKRFTLRQPVFELRRFFAKLIIGQLFEVSFEGVDALDSFGIGFKQAIVAATKNFF